jgi:hypothetical protein
LEQASLALAAEDEEQGPAAESAANSEDDEHGHGVSIIGKNERLR